MGDGVVMAKMIEGAKGSEGSGRCTTGFIACCGGVVHVIPLLLNTATLFHMLFRFASFAPAESGSVLCALRVGHMLFRSCIMLSQLATYLNI